MSSRVYVYEKCDTCRKALKFLKENSIAHEALPIRQQPPTVDELKAMLAHVGGDLRRLFNTSGLDYKALNMKERLPQLSQEEAFALLAGNGNLVKRPFLLGDGGGLVGFKESEWARFYALPIAG
ncbi:MAG: arsenate reductase-related protein [Chthoniobacteraceae bacterium]|nr:arsenate reductase-related protein [Chthoniobacteraceae bacterium]